MTGPPFLLVGTHSRFGFCGWTSAASMAVCAVPGPGAGAGVPLAILTSYQLRWFTKAPAADPGGPLVLTAVGTRSTFGVLTFRVMDPNWFSATTPDTCWKDPEGDILYEVR